MNVFLIGYRCSGKSSVGRQLARALGWPFVDTDVMITTDLGASIHDIVQRQGWKAFRAAERRMLDVVCGRRRQVVATGGGVPCDGVNVRQMKDSGVLVWLRASVASIEKRMRTDVTGRVSRPALGKKGALQEIRQTLQVRRPLYQAAADIWVQTDGLSIDAVCAAVMAQLAKAGYGEQFTT